MTRRLYVGNIAPGENVSTKHYVWRAEFARKPLPEQHFIPGMYHAKRNQRKFEVTFVLRKLLRDIILRKALDSRLRRLLPQWAE